MQEKPIGSEIKIKFLTAEAPQGVDSLNVDAPESRLANELSKRDYVPGIALGQGLRVGRASRCATTGADGPVCAQTLKAQQLQFLEEVIEIPVLTEEADHLRILKTTDVLQLQHTDRRSMPLLTRIEHANAADPAHRQAGKRHCIHANEFQQSKSNTKQ